MPIEIGGLVLYEIDELAELLKVHERTLRRYLNSGRLKGTKFGGRWMVRKEDLEAYFETGGDAAKE